MTDEVTPETPYPVTPNDLFDRLLRQQSYVRELTDKLRKARDSVNKTKDEIIRRMEDKTDD